MPGMMDTILNLGLNDEAVEGLKRADRERPVRVRQLPPLHPDVRQRRARDSEGRVRARVRGASRRRAARSSTPISTRRRCARSSTRYKKVVKKTGQARFPAGSARAARDGARRGVPLLDEPARHRVPPHLRHPRSHRHRRQRPDDGVRQHRRPLGAPASASRAIPATGAKEFYGEFLINAQGEDVVAGIRTPQPIRELEQVMPKAYKQLREITTRLEKHYKDVQDFEFTIQDERLFMLQTRSGKRTGYAAVVIATDLVAEKLITPKEAILLVDPEVAQPAAGAGLRSRRVEEDSGRHAGACRRRRARPAARWCSRPTTPSSGSNQGKQVILVRRETVPDDIHGMFVAQGILTATGGMTSHAAVVGRQMGKPSIVGAGALEIDEAAKQFRVDGQTVKEGDFVSFDGLTRRSEARAGRVEAERDPAGRQRHARRRRSRTSTSASTSCCRGPTSSAGWASAPTPTCRIRRSSPTRSARAASACAAPSTCSSARGASRSCSG